MKLEATGFVRRETHLISAKKYGIGAPITLVPCPYTAGPFTDRTLDCTISMGEGMQASSVESNKRRGNRTKAVLPVRIKGKNSGGSAFEELAHTLDVTPTGVRLGSVRRELSLKEEVTLFFRQRKMQFRVVWTKKMKGTSEFQVGLQAMTQEREVWGLGFAEQVKQPPQALDATPVSALA